ncbi:MAG: Lrp/AsnC family transcriptional regulator [Pseudomonadales bacterium]
MSKRLLDEVDKSILSWLSRDARTSNRKIAAELGVTEGTVRGRIRKMEDDKLIHITAVTNTDCLPDAMLVFMWIEVEKSSDCDSVAKTLADLPQIGFVGKMVGRFDILAITMVQNALELTEFLHSTISGIDGVRKTDCTLGVDFVKHDYSLSRIVD